MQTNEDIEWDSGICWPEFDRMTEEERIAYYKEHPFLYQNMSDYKAAIKKWILGTYPDDTEKYVDERIESDLNWIKACFKKKTPIDLVAVDLMYCCG